MAAWMWIALGWIVAGGLLAWGYGRWHRWLRGDFDRDE